MENNINFVFSPHSTGDLAAEAGEINRPRRRTKRMRPEMLSEKLIRTEYTVKACKILPLARVTEKITISLDEVVIGAGAKPNAVTKRSLKQDILGWKLNFPDETGKTKPRPHKLKIEEEELYSRYTNFGKSYLYDYEDDDVLGVKKDFKVFAGYIDPVTNALLSDLNLRKFYRQQEEAEGEPFDEESMNQECDFLEDTRGGSPCRITDSFLSDCPEMEVDSAIGSITASDSSGLSQETTTTSTTDPSIDSTLNESSLGNASHSTELNASEAADTSSIDTSSRVIPQMLMKVTKQKPEIELKINILGLPEKLLRKKLLFALPKELVRKAVIVKSGQGEVVEVKEKSNVTDFEFESGILNLPSTKSKKTQESQEPRKSPFITLNDLSSLPPRPETPTNSPSDSAAEDEADFIGFDDFPPEFNDSDVFTSTLNRLSLDSSLFLPKVSRSLSQDSGFLTPRSSFCRFSCDDAGPSDLDSGLGISCIDEDLSQIGNKSTLETIAEEKSTKEHLEAEKLRLLRGKTPEMDAAAIELTDKHKKLQAIADKRHQERLEQNTDVTVEVNKWHSYLKPILKASHARANFDIHELGTEILEGFPKQESSSSNRTVTFADVVKDKEQPDICRYFLSTLLLANTENIRLSVAPKGKDQVTEYKDMQLSFLSSERHFQEMEAMYDEQGVINTNVQKRMREVDAEEAQRTPKKKKISLLKVLEQSPTDSGYLSGFEEPVASGSGRKRSVNGEMKVVKKAKSTVVRNVLSV